MLSSRISLLGFLSLAAFGLVAFCYSVIPLIKKEGRPKGLKGSSLLKPLALVSVWTWLTLGLPALEAGTMWKWEFLLLLGLWGCMIFANAILFDIRDIEIDKKEQSPTLANRLGKQKAHSLIDLTLTALILLSVFYGIKAGQPLATASLCLIAFSYFMINLYYKSNSKLSFPIFLTADLVLAVPGVFLAGAWIIGY